MTRWHLYVVAVLAWLVAWTLRAEETFETLKVGSQTYSQVKVIGKTRTDIYIAHSGGLANLKVKHLDAEIQMQLGYDVPAAKPSLPAIGLAHLQAQARTEQIQNQVMQQMEGTLLKLDPRTLVGLLVGMAVVYLFFCYCCLLICKRTGQEPGLVVWFPIVQLFPMLKAARMPAWWFVCFLVPGLNLVASIVWCFKIAQACGKSAVTGLLLLLPVTSLFAFLYLAFSGGQETEDDFQPIKLDLTPG